MSKQPRHEKMYSKSPRIESDEEGKKYINKSPCHKTEDTDMEKESAQVNDGTAGIPVHVRHANERREMHNRHEMEHSMHDHQEGKDSKEEMHGRHEKEREHMHSRHEKEHNKGGHKKESAKSKERVKEEDGE